MALSPSLFASAFPTSVSPLEIRNLGRNQLTQVVTWPSTKTNRLSATALKRHPSLHEDTQCMGMDEHERKLKEAKHVLTNKEVKDVETLHIIDAIQTLGIEYHFEEEIEAALKKQHLIFNSFPRDRGFHDVALQFRLLRQGGYNVPADVFNNFKDERGKIKEKFTQDIMGLIELYEASQLIVEEEYNLDQLGDMSHQLLDAWASKHHDHPLSEVVSNTLQLPFHKSLSRFSNRSNYLNYLYFQENKGWASTLQELAEVDSYAVKSIHKQEILHVSKWWNDLGLAKELKFVRDEPLKWYIWSMACLTDPRLSEERIELTKPMSLVYIIDDVFDVCGSIDTLTLFTDAVNRWELEAAEQLPVHLKICFKVLYDITNEFAQKVYMKHGWNPINTLQKLWARLCSAFLVEAQWLASGHLPKAEEYLKNGLTTTGGLVMLGHAFFLLDNGITKEPAMLTDNSPGIISAVSTIVRLSDDLEGIMDDNQDAYDGSYLKCYMKEHQGISHDDTIKHVTHLISNSWKHINQECLTPTLLSTTLKKVCLNAARGVPLMYNCGSKYQLLRVEKHMRSLFSGKLGTGGGHTGGIPKDQIII